MSHEDIENKIRQAMSEVDRAASMLPLPEGQAEIHPSSSGLGRYRSGWLGVFAAVVVMLVGGAFWLRPSNDVTVDVADSTPTVDVDALDVKQPDSSAVVVVPTSTLDSSEAETSQDPPSTPATEDFEAEQSSGSESAVDEGDELGDGSSNTVSTTTPTTSASTTSTTEDESSVNEQLPTLVIADFITNFSVGDREEPWWIFEGKTASLDLTVADRKLVANVRGSSDFEGFAGFGHDFGPEDWTAYRNGSLRFDTKGAGTGKKVSLQIRDNGDERYIAEYVDRSKGWTTIELVIADFVRHSEDMQPNRAPNDGLTLTEVEGFVISFYDQTGRYEFDNFELVP